MTILRFLSPGVALMRSLRLSSKLLLLSVVMLVPALLGLVPLFTDLSAGTASVLLWCTGLFLATAVYLLLGFYQGLSQDVSQVRLAMDKMVQGDLRVSIVVRGSDELADLSASAAKIGATVSGMVANVRSNAAFVAHSGQSLAAGNRELSDRTEQ